jgi:hypothetical protein
MWRQKVTWQGCAPDGKQIILVAAGTWSTGKVAYRQKRCRAEHDKWEYSTTICVCNVPTNAKDELRAIKMKSMLNAFAYEMHVWMIIGVDCTVDMWRRHLL